MKIPKFRAALEIPNILGKIPTSGSTSGNHREGVWWEDESLCVEKCWREQQRQEIQLIFCGDHTKSVFERCFLMSFVLFDACWWLVDTLTAVCTPQQPLAYPWPCVGFSCSAAADFTVVLGAFHIYCAKENWWVEESSVVSSCGWYGFEVTTENGNQTFRTIDYSYHRRFVPWIFRTILGFFVPFVPRTFRTILGRFVPSLNSDVSVKLDDADDKPSTPRMDWWRHLTDRRTDGRTGDSI